MLSMERRDARENTPAFDPFIRTGGAPLYTQLAGMLRERIASGQWQHKEILPSIDLLMDEFGVSRVTVREAIKLLTAEGMLLPQRGRGTVVTAKIASRPLRVEGTLDDLIASYRGDKPEIETTANGFAVPELDESEGRVASSYFHTSRVHSREGTRYCHISLYIEKSIYGRAPGRFEKDLVLPLLRELDIEITHARQTVTIGKCSAGLSAILRYPAGDPIANVRRTLLGPDGIVLYFAQVAYRSDCIRFEMDLTP